jgi:Icc-related predicted phosphoesterase
MRWLIVSDLHYALPQFDWLLTAAPQFDLVIFAGDALDAGSIVDYGAQAVVVRKYLEKLSAIAKVIFCTGNHDLDAKSESGEKIARWIEEARSYGVVCDGDAVVFDDIFFSVFPWWDGPNVKEKLLAQLAADAARRDGRRWVWAHHAPPRNSPTSWSGKQSFGDAELVDWIKTYAPDFVISGHIHQAPFVADGSWADRLGSTWLINAGRQYGAPPAYIVVDTALGEALWISAMGVQSVKLDAPLQRPIAPLHALPDWFEPPPTPPF